MKEHEKGGYVRHVDYARLKAEAERYRLASLRVDVGELHAQFNRALFDETVAENARLKAEVERLMALLGDIVSFDEYHKLLQQVERLTKAGDAMADCLLWDTFNQASKEWRAAKGVQS